MTSDRSVWLTAGLNRPPLTRKNTQTLTIKLNPNTRLMYSSTLVFGACVMLFDCWPEVAGSLAIAAVFATCVPPNAKNKNMNVPANSAAAATNSLRHRFVIQPLPFLEWLVCGCAPSFGSPEVPGASLEWIGRRERIGLLGMMAVLMGD